MRDLFQTSHIFFISDSRISIEEFLPIYNNLKKEAGLFEEELIGMLSNFDREGNGLVHITDLRFILVNTGIFFYAIVIFSLF